MGEDAVERQATPEEITRMKQLVRQGMEAGAVGFSTNQNPRHIREDKKPVASRLASDEELGSLLDVLGEMNAGVVQIERRRRRLARSHRLCGADGAAHGPAGFMAKHQS